jgi:hypothetical protein
MPKNVPRTHNLAHFAGSTADLADQDDEALHDRTMTALGRLVLRFVDDRAARG